MTAAGAFKEMHFQIERYISMARPISRLVVEADIRARLYETSALSDLTITCGGQVFAVHKVILYVQSDYFRTLLDGPFKVSPEIS